MFTYKIKANSTAIKTNGFHMQDKGWIMAAWGEISPGGVKNARLNSPQLKNAYF
jgi:hypothetical protein